LGARTGAVDLVGHQELAEYGARDEAERTPPALAFLEHFGSEDVGGHQVGGALDALVVEPQNRAEGFDKPRLGEPGHADQQCVAARQQRDQGLLDDLGLAENDLTDALANQAQALAQRFDLGDEISLTLGGVCRNG
jgi:hypothetical protein